MSSSHSHRHHGPFAAMLLAGFAVLCISTIAAAQDQPAPKWELYGGYSFFHPGADIHGVLPLGLLPVSSRLEPNPRGLGASVTYDFNRWFGLTLDSSTSWNSGEVGTDRVDDTALSNLSLGPKFTFRHHRFSPFLEVLVGDHRLMPDAFHDIQKLGIMAGGGHANFEHPAIIVARRAATPSIDPNTFIVQPPASVTWLAAPQDDDARFAGAAHGAATQPR